eukprot:g324.t1
MILVSLTLVVFTKALIVVDVHPHDSLLEAQKKARAIGPGAVVRLLPGRHIVDASRSISLDARDSGITWTSAVPGTASISGGVEIAGPWTSCDVKKYPNLLCAPAPLEAVQQRRHLYVNGRRIPRSKAPDAVTAAFANPIAVDSDKYVVSNDSGVASWDPANAAGVEMVYTANGSPWTESRCTVDRVNRTDDDGHFEVYMKQPCFASVQQKPCGQSTHVPAHIENTGLADVSVGEWLMDDSSPSNGPRIVYSPLPGERDEIDSLEVVIPVAENLLRSSPESRVENVSFEDIIFQHATWLHPNSGEGYVEQQSGALVTHPGTECVDFEWLPMPSNIMMSGARGTRFVNCTFRHLGAGAVTFDHGASDNIVQGCIFEDVSGTAVQIGRYDTFNVTDPAKQELRNMVVDCNISNVATEFHGNAGIQAGYTSGTRIERNLISSLTYSGISIGWGWSRELETYASNNIVNQNRIDRFKLQTPYPGAALGDGGGVYALGPQQGSRMTGNWLSNMGSGRGGGAYYPDEGSAYWDISNNVFSNASFCTDDCEWLHIWTSSIHDITTHECYTDTATQENHGTNTSLTNITVVTNGDWPAPALSIMRNAGPAEGALDWSKGML